MPTFQRCMAVSYSTSEATETTMMEPRIFKGTRAKNLVRKRRTNPTTHPHTNWENGVFEPEKSEFLTLGMILEQDLGQFNRHLGINVFKALHDLSYKLACHFYMGNIVTLLLSIFTKQSSHLCTVHLPASREVHTHPIMPQDTSPKGPHSPEESLTAEREKLPVVV